MPTELRSVTVKIRILTLVLTLAFGGAGLADVGRAQNNATSKAAFGTPVEAYELRPGVLVTVARYPDGSLREMIVVGSPIAGSADLETALTEDDVPGLIDQLAPAETRGDKDEFYGLMMCAGGCTTHYNYSNVRIYFDHRDKQRANKPRLVLRWPKDRVFDPN